MKKTILILLAALMMTSCYKTAQPSGTHKCGHITQGGTYCDRDVSGTSAYCWQHK